MGAKPKVPVSISEPLLELIVDLKEIFQAHVQEQASATNTAFGRLVESHSTAMRRLLEKALPDQIGGTTLIIYDHIWAGMDERSLTEILRVTHVGDLAASDFGRLMTGWHQKRYPPPDK